MLPPPALGPDLGRALTAIERVGQLSAREGLPVIDLLARPRDGKEHAAQANEEWNKTWGKFGDPDVYARVALLAVVAKKTWDDADVKVLVAAWKNTGQSITAYEKLMGITKGRLAKRRPKE